MNQNQLAGVVAESSPTSESVKVLVRVRPLNYKEQGELANAELAVQINSPSSLSVTSVDQKKTFQCSYDSVLGPYATQSQVYDKVKECTMAVMNGINATIFAYGQTGSGKTHSMYGPPNYINTNARETDQLGVIPRAINHIFELSKTSSVVDFQVHCSFVQLYNENLYDMLRDPGMSAPLTIREDNNKEIYVQGLSEYNVKSVSDTLQLLKIAEENRAIRETHMNQFSSRSHSIFQIFVEFKRMAEDSGKDGLAGEVHYRSKFNLIDLAGSEKWDIRRELREEHIAEMTNINLSLHTLGKCISSLAKISRKKQKATTNLVNNGYSELDTQSISSLDGGFGGLNLSSSFKTKPSTASQIHVPFRESKLTRLLQDSLGGSAKTFLIATVSPAKTNCDESISTLKFADRAKQVMVQTVVNESRPVDYAVVKKLQLELEMLRSLLRRVTSVANRDQLSLFLAPQYADMSDQEKTYLNKVLEESSSTMSHNMSFNNAVSIDTNSIRETQSTLVQSPSKQRTPKIISSHSEDEENYSQHNRSMAEQGSTLEYVISLEKALNKEQVHAQHLTKKNETLIKELEELKMTNMQLTYQQKKEGGSWSGVGSGYIDEADDMRNFDSKQMKNLLDSVKDVIKQNENMVLQTEQIQKVVKKFFKFQLEEEEMKTELNKIFDSVKLYKGHDWASKINDYLISLESSANRPVNKPCSSPIRIPLDDNISHTSKSNGSHDKNCNSHVNSMADQHSNNNLSRRNPKAQTRSLPQLHHSIEDSKPKPDMEIQVPSSSSSQQKHMKAASKQQPPVDASVFNDLEAPPSTGISFRVRGGGPQSNVGAEGWVMPTPAQQVEDEEERLRQELKKYKKKQKYQEKLQQWAREKEEKAQAEQKALEDEKKTMQQAELQREAKRKEYAEKQKAKLAAYQDRVKTEAEKIQELINLGIDPKSLNLS